jgi:hypothetical protein
VFPSPDILIIPHFRGFVKSFFQKGENLFFPRQPSPDGLGDPALTVAVRAVFFIRELNFVIHLITSLSFVPLLYHNFGGLSRGFLNFFKIFFFIPYREQGMKSALPEVGSMAIWWVKAEKPASRQARALANALEREGKYSLFPSRGERPPQVTMY